MSDILADYREWRSEQEERIGTHTDDCHMWPRHERCMIHRLAVEVERLRNGATEACETVSQDGDFPASDNAANEDNNERLAALQALAAQDDELGLPRRTPAANATPSQGSVRNGCTLTDAERADIRMAATRRLPSDEPAAYGVLRVGGGWVSILANEVQAETSRTSFDTKENWVHEVIPLYRLPPTLTGEEREAVERAVGFCECTTSPLPTSNQIATLRGLLERTK